MFVFCDNPLFCIDTRIGRVSALLIKLVSALGLYYFCRKYGNGLYFDIIKICFFCFLK